MVRRLAFIAAVMLGGYLAGVTLLSCQRECKCPTPRSIAIGAFKITSPDPGPNPYTGKTAQPISGTVTITKRDVVFRYRRSPTSPQFKARYRRP